MTLEELIYQVVTSLPEIQAGLASYAGKPAVFYQQIPHNKERGWENGQQFPRIIYMADWEYSGKRKKSGRLAVDIFCTNENTIGPEQLSKALVAGLSDTILTKGGETCLIQWDRTEGFAVESKEPSVPGATVYFDILCFPVQEGESPCPVWGVNQFIADQFPEITVLGKRLGGTGVAAEPVRRAAGESPFLYVQQVSQKNVNTNYARAWLHADLDISIFAGSLEGNKRWTEKIMRPLAIEQEAVMENGSPFLIMEINGGDSGDLEKKGQLLISGQFGIMRQERAKEKLRHINMERRWNSEKRNG